MESIMGNTKSPDEITKMEIAQWTGLRPLVLDPNNLNDTKSISRDFVIEESKSGMISLSIQIFRCSIDGSHVFSWTSSGRWAPEHMDGLKVVTQLIPLVIRRLGTASSVATHLGLLSPLWLLRVFHLVTGTCCCTFKPEDER